MGINSLVRTIWGDSKNVIWFGTWDDGLLGYDGSEWIHLTTEDGLLDNRIFAVSVDDEDVVWIGSEHGLTRYNYYENPSFIDEQDQTPEPLLLIKTFPNPFNPSTTIEFTLPKSGFTTITIYSLTGQKIRELTADYMNAGTHTLSWDGKDVNGNTVSSGIYITRLQAGKYTATGRMVLVR